MPTAGTIKPRPLTPDELSFYRREGYVVVKGVLDDVDFVAFEEEYTALISTKADELYKYGPHVERHPSNPQ
jgi:hypothetical protein